MNWRALSDGRPTRSSVEFACYSDAPLTGLEAVLGPYRLLNTLATAIAPRPGSSRLALVLRAEQHLEETDAPEAFWERTDTTTYHGGQLDDELAALTSLALGIRLSLDPPRYAVTLA